MVQVFNMTPTPSNASMIGEALGQGIAKRFPDPQQQVQRGMLQKALQEAKMAVNNPNAKPMDKLFAFMEAGAGIPGSERYMSALLPEILKLSQAEASQNAPFGMGGQGGQTQDTSQQDLQGFLQNNQQQPQQNQFYPSNQGGQQAPGNLPQAATGGVKQPVASNQQLLQMSKPYAAQKTAAGIPTTPTQAYEELKAINADNQEANKLVEVERKERVASQREYGKIAQSKLDNVMPGASDEEVSYIKKQVEELAGENRSEADIERLASAEARKYKNMISKVENGLTAERSYNKPFRNMLGNSKSDETARRDLRLKVQPLLDAGLYDKARSVLANAKYYPEEIEMTIANLGENSLKNINKMPKLFLSEDISFKKGYPEPLEIDGRYTSQDQVQSFKQNLKDVLSADPSTNMILLRRKYEQDKNVGWRLFKDTVNETIEEGLFKPNDDQFNQLDTLDEPPLNNLERLMYKVGLIGR